MSRGWKCGDVAVATVRGAQDVRVMRVDFSTAMGQRYYGWASYAPIDRTNLHEDAEVADARPVVVIDPEDREAVERLYDLLFAKSGHPYVPAVQAALREFANPTPPKPDEPTGLGAVVEDAEGEWWVQFSSKTGDWWRNHQGQNRRYADIKAVRVLSEGVTA